MFPEGGAARKGGANRPLINGHSSKTSNPRHPLIDANEQEALVEAIRGP